MYQIKLLGAIILFILEFVITKSELVFSFKVQGHHTLFYVDVTSPPGPMAATSISSKPIAQAGELVARV